MMQTTTTFLHNSINNLAAQKMNRWNAKMSTKYAQEWATAEALTEHQLDNANCYAKEKKIWKT